MAFQMTDAQDVVLSIKAVDKKGNPTTIVPGSVEWLVDNPNVATITPNPDGTAKLSAVGPLGTVLVTVNADVTGDPAPDISGTFECEIISGAPTQITVEPGTPTEQP